MLTEIQKRKRYLVTVQYMDRLEQIVVIAESPKAMQKIVHKLFKQSVGETEIIVSFIESELV